MAEEFCQKNNIDYLEFIDPKKRKNIDLKNYRKLYNEKGRIYRKTGRVPRAFSKKDKRWQELRKTIFHVYGKRCMKCGTNKKSQIDHILPKSKFPEGAYSLENLQVLCAPCNKIKSNTDFTDYRTTDDVLSLIDFLNS